MRLRRQEQLDRLYMRMACRLAAKAAGRTSPNPMVGAVLLRDGKMIASGFHQFAGGDHAEIVALEKAGSKAKGAILYINLEPCNHYGRTPPCTRALIAAGVKEIVVGMKDPNPLVSGKGLRACPGRHQSSHRCSRSRMSSTERGIYQVHYLRSAVCCAQAGGVTRRKDCYGERRCPLD